MADITTPVPSALMDAMKNLWLLRPPGPENIFSAKAFKQLTETCTELYPPSQSSDALGFALHNALRCLGLPCALPETKQSLSLAVEEAAWRLNEAFGQTKLSRVHLVPLDYAGDLPPLAFGPAIVKRFSSAELAELIDLPRLKRSHPEWRFDGDGLSHFTWLLVREDVPLEREPGKRAAPFFYTSIDLDMGAIDPHQQRFPVAVNIALFTLLLAPWEEWAEYTEVDWRPFRTPWSYTADDDIFAARSAPPRSDTLGWEPCIYTDRFGEPIEAERPISLLLADSAARADQWVSAHRWDQVQAARQAGLFAGPVIHFLNRAFLSTGIDEFLAHITVIEAALGTSLDFDAAKRPKIMGKNPGATKRVAARLAGLLGEDASSDNYQRLFDVRSAFVHGRTLGQIPTSDRVLARSLARRTASALIDAATKEPALSREAFLKRLLDV